MEGWATTTPESRTDQSICSLAHFSDFLFFVALSRQDSGNCQKKRRRVCRQHTHTRALFLAAHACARQMWVHLWSKGLTICLSAQKVISSLVMSLLHVPSTPFDHFLTISSFSHILLRWRHLAVKYRVLFLLSCGNYWVEDTSRRSRHVSGDIFEASFLLRKAAQECTTVKHARAHCASIRDCLTPSDILVFLSWDSVEHREVVWTICCLVVLIHEERW